MNRRNSKGMTGRDFDALTDIEKERIYGECEKLGTDEGRPLTQDEKALHSRINRKAGRPKVGKGAARVNITVERGLLTSADRLAKRKGMSRSELIAVGLRTLMSA